MQRKAQAVLERSKGVACRARTAFRPVPHQEPTSGATSVPRAISPSLPVLEVRFGIEKPAVPLDLQNDGLTAYHSPNRRAQMLHVKDHLLASAKACDAIM